MKNSPKTGGATRKRKPAGVLKLHPERYVLSLYISGSTLKSALAVDNIKRVCEHYLKNRYRLEVIDVYQRGNVARNEEIVALPTLIRRLPLPLRRLIGDLSNEEELVLGLDLGKRV